MPRLFEHDHLAVCTEKCKANDSPSATAGAVPAKMINIAGLKRKTLCRAKEVDTQQREKEKAMKKAYLNNMGTDLIPQGLIVLFF